MQKLPLCMHAPLSLSCFFLKFDRRAYDCSSMRCSDSAAPSLLFIARGGDDEALILKSSVEEEVAHPFEWDQARMRLVEWSRGTPDKCRIARSLAVTTRTNSNYYE
jgi:hypothetical protein